MGGGGVGASEISFLKKQVIHIKSSWFVIILFCRSVFFGDVTPKDKPEFYIQCIRNVYQTYANSYKNKVPLIVNTQGWVKGELPKQTRPALASNETCIREILHYGYGKRQTSTCCLLSSIQK